MSQENIDVIKARSREEGYKRFEKGLAAAQAQVAALRAVLDRIAREARAGGFEAADAYALLAAKLDDAALVMAIQEAVDSYHDRIKLRLPADWTDNFEASLQRTLREFGLKVARLAYDAGLERPIPHTDAGALVDAVLRGES